MIRFNLYRPIGRSRTTGARILRRLGPSWAATSVRRGVQTTCLVLFMCLLLYVCWPYGGQDISRSFAAKERIAAEIFLILDPLVSVSTALAARQWVGSLAGAGLILGVCLILPRGFCAYLCPLGTVLHVFGWLLGRWASPSRLKIQGRWRHLKYVVLGIVLLAAAFGVLLTGFVAAIPLFTRAMVFLFNPLQTGMFRGWYQVPNMHAGHSVAIGLSLGILLLCLIEKRFWCKYLCPTGALFCVANLLRLTERKVTRSCTQCDRCRKACDFAAIREDYSTRHHECSFCQACGGACPVQAISFAGRCVRESDQMAGSAETLTHSRRSVLAGVGCAGVLGMGIPLAIGRSDKQEAVVRAPGTVPEGAFLQTCVRCAQCIKVCPSNVLQPMGFEHGLNSLWTPQVVADWSGCEPTCNNCGQVCPTGAIRALPIEEKRAARMALAVVDETLCLPYAGSGQCRLCMEECKAAGYDAIEFVRVGGDMDDQGQPVPGSGLLAPVVLTDRCVGCGLCQMRCHGINVKQKHRLDQSAIRLVAGEGNEDRISSGSYIELQQARQDARHQKTLPQDAGSDYLPDFLK